MAASARIDELRSKFDDNPRRYFASLANEYRKAGDLTTAIAICRTQLRHFPTHMSGHVVLGQALFESGELDAARVAFERAVELDPENLIALRHLGDAAMARHDVESARRWYRRVLDIDAGNDAIATQLLTLEAPPVRVVEPEPPARVEPAVEPSVEPTVEPVVEPSPETEPARATGFVDFDPDELSWPAPASQDIPTVADEVPAFLEAEAPAEPAGDAAPADDTGFVDGDDTGFVDGWDTLDVADLSETIEVPVPALPGLDLATEDVPDRGAERREEPDDPVVGLDLPPDDDAGLRELAHVEVESTLVDWLPAEPPAEPVTELAAEPPAEAAAPAAARVPAADAETAPLDEVIASGAFVTETMAELCVRQGHDDEALAIYEQLVAQRPDDARLAARLADVRTRLGRPAAPSVSDPAGDYLRALAERRPAEAAVVPPAPDEADATTDSVADSVTDSITDAVSDLTLEYPTPIDNEAVAPPAASAPSERDAWAAAAWGGAFRADAAPEHPLLAGLEPRDTGPDLSFDRFFVGLEETTEQDHEAEPEPATTDEREPDAEPAATPDQDADQDLADFNAWLRGLRDA